MNYQAPIQRIGTPFQKPAWRYHAVTNPLKYGFCDFCTKPKNSSKSLNRLVQTGITYYVARKYPEYFSKLSNILSSELNEVLIKIWKKYLRKQYKNDLRIDNISKYNNFVNWNIRKLDELKDLWLKKLVLHEFGNKQYPEIEFALNLKINKQFEQQLRFIGLEIFAHETDKDIAKRWKLPVKNIAAIRNLFFDFSYFPESRVAQWSLLAQLANNRDIDTTDLSMYRRVYELGSLGVKAQVDGYHLDEEERLTISNYLTKSAMVNTFDIQFGISSKQDRKDYNGVLATLVDLNMEKDRSKLRAKQLELVDFNLRKAMRDDGETTQALVQVEDIALLSEALVELTAHDATPKYREYIDIAQIKD
jgi:hypothetical protein